MRHTRWAKVQTITKEKFIVLKYLPPILDGHNGSWLPVENFTSMEDARSAVDALKKKGIQCAICHNTEKQRMLFFDEPKHP